nr:hypothetical protein [Arthrobacter sp. SRS-W-1-2016]
MIGDPVRFVQSPLWLTRTFAARGHNGICIPMEVPEGDLEVVMAGLTATPNVDGILVTMPHKFAALEHCATSSARARMLGVVSVIRRNADGTWRGDVLDGLAFVKAQQDRGARITGARALLVGAGGAGSAIAIALLEAGIGQLIIHDADEARVAGLLELLADFGNGQVSTGSPDPAGCDLVLNATPMGMDVGDQPPVDATLLTACDGGRREGKRVAGHAEWREAYLGVAGQRGWFGQALGFIPGFGGRPP